ncbi:hypothetical protein RUND412_005339 [Rhizina undulata]
MEISSLKFEHLSAPSNSPPTNYVLCIAEPTPRISWTIRSEKASPWVQSEYEIEIRTSDSEFADYRLKGSESVFVPWPGAPLRPGARTLVTVRLWGSSDALDSSPSVIATACVTLGFIGKDDWKGARFVTGDWEEDPQIPHPETLLRKSFEFLGDIRDATLSITALGVYEVEINGEIASDAVLAPGWTSYNHQLRYQTYNVGELLRQGSNAIGVRLGEGWFRGRLGFHGGNRAIYGDRTAVLARLHIRRRDGIEENIVSDLSWRSTTGPILASEIYNGETYDARLEKALWSSPSCPSEESWSKVQEVPFPETRIVPSPGPPSRRIEEVSPVKVFTTPAGCIVVDFGQNLVGRVKLRVDGTGHSGRQLKLVHVEVLEKDGEIATKPLREAKATDTYIIRGLQSEIWEPRFTFHGFRYVQITGYPDGIPLLENLKAVVCHTDMDRTGWWECSEPRLNKLHENIRWSMRGNFLEVPTDCPQRDERLGWTGDLQVFAPTACYLYDCAGMLSGWLQDFSAEQFESESGIPPLVVPDVIRGLWGPRMPQAVWQDAAVIVPWVLYRKFGDIEILRRQYTSMVTWVEKGIPKDERGLWKDGFQLGDWLDPNAPGDDPAAGRTDALLVANAFLVHCYELLTEIATILEKLDDAKKFALAATNAKEQFAREYITPTGLISSDSQTAYVLAMRFNLFPTPQQRTHAAERLAKIVRTAKFRISTGFAGTPYILDALTSAGYPQLAYRMLLEEKCPSWLYPISMGATTIWERWDSMLPDRSVNPAEMTSFNHYALGAVAEWLHATVAGVREVEAGWRRFEVRPVPGGTLTWVETRFLCRFGEIKVRWEIVEGIFRLRLTVPTGCNAEVALPGEEGRKVVGGGDYVWEVAYSQPDWPPEPIRHVFAPSAE